MRGLLVGLGAWLGLHYGPSARGGGPGAAGAREARPPLPPPADPAQEVIIEIPAEGESWSGATAQTFSWRVGGTSARHTAPPHRLLERHPLHRPHRASARLASRFIAAAEAHGPPVFGRAYLLVVEDPSGHIVHQVFTLDLTHVPDEVRWRKLREADQPLRASVLNAVFDDNAIAEGGGPWQGPTREFRIAD